MVAIPDIRSFEGLSLNAFVICARFYKVCRPTLDKCVVLSPTNAKACESNPAI